MRPCFMVWLMCKFLTTVTAARERPDALRKAASVNPLLATFLLHWCKRPLWPYKSSSDTQKLGAKARGCKHQQRETALRELLSAISQEPEPVCVSCPKTSLLIHKYLQNTVPGHCFKQTPEGRRG